MTATNRKVISLLDNDGQSTQYLRVSARIPQFLAEYGPQKGYRVLSEISDYQDVTENRMAFMLALIQNGQLPEDRIEEILNDKKFVFRSKLLDKEGNVIAEATAVKRVWREKDFETGETAAFQRLMARVGFGGELFDIDENNDIEDQNITYQAATAEPGNSKPVTAVPVSENNQTQEQLEQTVEPASDESQGQEQPEPEESAKTAEAKAPVEPQKPAGNKRSAPAADKSDKKERGTRANVSKVQPAQLKVLASQARIKGVECPVVETIEQFQQELAKIRNLPLPE